MNDDAKCRRCKGVQWVPVEGTITCAIEAMTDPNKRMPCPECAVTEHAEGEGAEV